MEVTTKITSIEETLKKYTIQSLQEAEKNALDKAGLTLNDIDAFAVTQGAGLLGALLVGVSFAKSLAISTGKPLIPVRHIRGHIRKTT